MKPECFSKMFCSFAHLRTPPAETQPSAHPFLHSTMSSFYPTWITAAPSPRVSPPLPASHCIPCVTVPTPHPCMRPRPSPASPPHPSPPMQGRMSPWMWERRNANLWFVLMWKVTERSSVILLQMLSIEARCDGNVVHTTTTQLSLMDWTVRRQEIILKKRGEWLVAQGWTRVATRPIA